MAHVVAFLNQKGGVGKTTLAVHVAWQLSGSADVLLLDADPQESASQWAGLREESPFVTVACAQPNLHRQVDKMRDRYDWILIDGPPRGDRIVKSCIAAADLVAVPIEPSGLSARASDRIVNLLVEAEPYLPGLQCRFVVSRKKARTVIGREMRHLATGLPVLETEITERVLFVRAMTYGQTVQELEPESPGAVELAALATELKQCLQPRETTA